MDGSPPEAYPPGASGAVPPADPADTLLRSAGLTSTPQRRAIWRAIAERRDHPTPDQVFESLAPSDAGISRTTVYRTLEAFVGAGLLQRVGHLEGGTRFDPRVETHDHFLCEVCGSIRDLDPPTATDPAAERRANLAGRGLTISRVSLLVQGRCADCAPIVGA